jgi:hypothetical protein
MYAHWKMSICIAAIGTMIAFVSGAEDQKATPKEQSEREMIESHIRNLRKMVAGPADQARPQVLLFGTFHFSNPGLDAHKPKYTFDVFSEKGQKELNEVLDRLAEFKPTKIVIEKTSSDQKGIDEWFEGYKKGNFNKNPNESLTVAFALAKRLNHTKVYGFDAQQRWLPDLPESNEEWKTKAKAMGMEDRLTSKTYEKFSAMYKAQDEIKEGMTLRQRLLMMNHPDSIRLSHGAYFFWANFEIADGKEFPGPDGFISAWHNRNLRMFSTIQRIASDPNDRILVVVGAGHIPILQHCVQTCPTMKWVDMWDVLGSKK